MKVTAYVLTFVGLATLYMLRQGYNFSKPYFRTHFQYSILFVSMIDACLYGGMGIGYLLRYRLIDERRPMKHFLCMSLSMCLLFSFLPMASLLTTCLPSKTIQILLMICIFLFGFLQFYFIPCFQTVLQKYYFNHLNEWMMSIWNGAGQFGKIIGFIFMSIAGRKENFQWQQTLLVFIGIMIVVSLAIYEYLGGKVQNNQDQNINLDNITLSTHNSPYQVGNQQILQAHAAKIQITWEQFKQFVGAYFFRFQTIVYLLLGCCYRSTYINFLLWLSDFMFHHNYQQLTGQLAIVFILAVIAGAFVVGKMYEHIVDQADQRQYSIYFMSTLTLFVFGSSLTVNFLQVTYVQFVMMIMVIGISIGGSLKIIAFNGHVLVGHSPKRLEMLVTLTRGVTYMSVGAVDIVIGLLMNIRKRQKSPFLHDSSFNVLFVVCVFSMILLILWIWQIRLKQKSQRE